MTSRPKRHLPWHWQVVVSQVRRAACGLENPSRFSFDPAEVNCIPCKRTLKMADAEVAHGLRPRSVLNRKA